MEETMTFKKGQMVAHIDEPDCYGEVTRLYKDGTATVNFEEGPERLAQEDLRSKRGRPPGTGRKIPDAPQKRIKLKRKFTEVVQSRMADLNLSWSEMERRTGLARSTLYRLLENNGGKAYMDTIETLAVALEVEPAAFWDVRVRRL